MKQQASRILGCKITVPAREVGDSDEIGEQLEIEVSGFALLERAGNLNAAG